MRETPVGPGGSGTCSTNIQDACDSTLPVVVMTARSSIEVARRQRRDRARAIFVQKALGEHAAAVYPRTTNDLRQALRQALAAGSRESHPARGVAADVSGKSPAMAPVLELIGRIGPSDANVLIPESTAPQEVAGANVHAFRTARRNRW